MNIHEQMALKVLGIDHIPGTGLDSIVWGGQHASGEWIDYEIVSQLLYLGDEVVIASELGELIGCGGQRAAGRLESLRQRGIVKRASRSEAMSMWIDNPPLKRGQAWRLTAKVAKQVIG